MAKKNSVNITIQESEIRAGLKRIIRSDHSQLIVDSIIGHLSQHNPGLEDLFLAMAGIEKKLAFKPTDEVYVPLGRLPSWKVNKENTREAGLANKDYVVCVVKEVNHYASYRVHVKWTAKNDQNEDVSGEDWMNEDWLFTAEEQFPADPDNDLPF